MLSAQTPATKTFTSNTSPTLGILERYQRLLQAMAALVEWWLLWDKRVDLQWFLRGWQLLADFFRARKMDVKRGYYLSAEYLIGRHMQPLGLDGFVFGFDFFVVFEVRW